MSHDAELDRCYRHPDRETGLACSECGRPICPECTKMTPVGQRCPECVGKQRTIRPRAAGGQMMPVTGALIAINLVVYLAGSLTNTDMFRQFGLNAIDLAGSGQWRLITSMFIHAGLVHVGLNMYSLYWIGPSLEARLGAPRYLALYLAAGLWGGAGAMVLQPTDTYHGIAYATQHGGASGAIFGLLGALAIVIWRSGSRDFSQVGLLIVLNLGFSFYGSGISWSAHIGGLVGGALVTLVFEVLGNAKVRERAVAEAVAVAAGIGLIGAIVAFLAARHTVG